MRLSRLIVAIAIAAAASPAHAQVLRVDSLTTTEFAALDRSRTAVVIPGGILEEHGPYLPSGSDMRQAQWLADALARRIAARPGWTALMLPMLPFGHSGANDITRQWIYPGSVTIRADTLRAIYMDLADTLGQHGFRYVFIVDVHGAPDHNRMLDQASDYFADTWKGVMVAPMGLKTLNTLPPLPAAIVSEAAAARDGFTVHAGLAESSRVVFVSPGEVKPAIADAPPLTAKDFGDLVRAGRTPAWRGYWGAPAAATTTIGAAAMDPQDVQISRESAAREETLRARQDAWLKAKGLR